MSELNGSVGMTFRGYKGGDFKMDKNTPAWVSNYGSCDDLFVTGVEPDGTITVEEEK